MLSTVQTELGQKNTSKSKNKNKEKMTLLRKVGCIPARSSGTKFYSNNSNLFKICYIMGILVLVLSLFASTAHCTTTDTGAFTAVQQQQQQQQPTKSILSRNFFRELAYFGIAMGIFGVLAVAFCLFMCLPSQQSQQQEEEAEAAALEANNVCLHTHTNAYSKRFLC